MSTSQTSQLKEYEELFLLAAEHGEMKTLRQLLREHGPALLEVRGRTDDMALHRAAKNGQLTAVCALVSQGANVNATGFAGATPLHDAAYEGHLDVVEHLIEEGADINSVSASGTALMSSMYQGHHEIMRLLLNKGALIRKEGDDPERPNELACEENWDAFNWIRRNDDVTAFKEFVDRGLIRVEAPATLLDWVLAEQDVDVSRLVIACLGDTELGGEITFERIQRYLCHNKNENVAAVLRADALRFELEQAVGHAAPDAPTHRPRQTGVGL